MSKNKKATSTVREQIEIRKAEAKLADAGYACYFIFKAFQIALKVDEENKKKCG